MKTLAGAFLFAAAFFAFTDPITAREASFAPPSETSEPEKSERSTLAPAEAQVPVPESTASSIQPQEMAVDAVKKQAVEVSKAVETQKLDAADPDAAGLLSPSVGGLGAALWDGSQRSLVELLMTSLDLPGSSPVLNGLARRLLLSTAAVPQGETTLKRSLTALRLEKVLALGNAAEAWKLFEHVKPEHVDKITLRLLIEAALIEPDSAAACKRVPELMAGNDSAEWQKALMLCQLRAGDANAVQLGLDVMREQQAKDDVFIFLVNRALQNNKKKLPRQLTPLRPVTLGLLRHLDTPLPSGIYARPDALLVAGLLQTKSEDDNMRLILAEKAASRGIISAAELGAVYRSSGFPPEAITNISMTKEAGARLRALLFQAASQEQPGAGRAALVARFMKEAEASLLYGAGGQALAELAIAIPASADAAAHAAHMARLMVFAGKPERALEWLKLAKGAAEKDAEIAAQLQSAWPLLVLSGVVTDTEYGKEIKTWLQALLSSAGNDPAQERSRRQQAVAVLVMFAAAGYAVPEDAMLSVMGEMAETKRMNVPSPILLDRLRNAGTNNHRGEAVLLSVLLGSGGAEDTPLFVLADIVRALRLVGLTGDAMALARETVAGYQ